MPQYLTQQHAIDYHKAKYKSDGDRKGTYEKWHSNRPRIQAIINLIPEESYILDIGCNSGGLARRIMSQKGCFIKGIDVVPNLVTRARGKGIYAQEGRAEDLPFSDNEFDVVLMAETLEHLYDPAPAVKEALRVLKPDGLFIGSCPSWESERIKKPRAEMIGDSYHAQIMTKKKLKQLFKPFKLDLIFTDIKLSREYQATIGYMGPRWYVFHTKKTRTI